MTQATDTDIRDLKDLITGLRDEMRAEFAIVKTDIKVINTRLGAIDGRLSTLEGTTQKIPDLAEKVGELKNWKQIAIVIFTATVGATIGYFVKIGKF